MARSYREKALCCRCFLFWRRKTHRTSFWKEQKKTDSEMLSEFLKQFYASGADHSPTGDVARRGEEMGVIKERPNTRRGGKKVEIILRRVSKMAAENAAETLAALKAQWEADTNKQSEALAELQNALQLPVPPNASSVTIYPISRGRLRWSMVVFEEGVPSKKLYRRFNIKTVESPDDFASMKKVTRPFYGQPSRWIRWRETRSGFLSAAGSAHRRRWQGGTWGGRWRFLERAGGRVKVRGSV